MKYFSYFSQKTGFDISCKLSPIDLDIFHIMTAKIVFPFFVAYITTVGTFVYYGHSSSFNLGGGGGGGGGNFDMGV